MGSLQKFDEGYKGLYGNGNEQDNDEGRGGNSLQQFNRKFGWLYNAKIIADFENITVTQAFDLGVIYALNVLSYLKSKTEMDNEEIKKTYAKS